METHELTPKKLLWQLQRRTKKTPDKDTADEREISGTAKTWP